MSDWVSRVISDKAVSATLMTDLAAFLRQGYSDSVKVAKEEIKLVILAKEGQLNLSPPSVTFPQGGPLPTFNYSKTPSAVLSSEAYEFIKGEEGYKVYRYPDPSKNGTMNIGLGHQILPSERFNEPISDAEVKALFARDWVRFYNHVIDSIKIPLKNESIIALASLAYSIGHIPPSIVKAVNNRNLTEAVAKWNLYIKAEDVNKVLRVLPVLVGRRARESALFLKGFR